MAIAVIGILAGIIFVATGPIRKQAKDARIQSDLVQIQNRAERIYLDEGNYDNVCCGCDVEIQSLCNDIDNQGSSINIYKDSSPAGKYCAYASLASSGVASCVDYKGNIAELTYPEVTGDLCMNRKFCVFCDAQCYDFNGNGVIDSSDVDFALDCVGWTPGHPTLPAECYLADVDCSQAVTFSDVQVVSDQIGEACEL